MTTTTTEGTAGQSTTDLAAEYEWARLQLEEILEATADATRMLAADDHGWSKAGDGAALDREYIRSQIKLARVMAVADPLIRRGVNLRIAYVWGMGVTVQADPGSEGGEGEPATQDVNEIVQAFWDDPSNVDSFSSGQAHERMERSLATDGERFLALFTTPRTGRVEVRSIPSQEIGEIVTNPEDAQDPWFYRRDYTAKTLAAGGTGLETTSEARTVYYPSINYRPRSLPTTLNGKEIMWDSPILHVAVNQQEGSLRGTPDVLAALPWAQGYRGFLEDWARLVKAYSRIAWSVTAKTGAGAAAARSAFATARADVDGPVGQTAIIGEGQKLEAVGKSGATIDSRSGFPLAAMTAAALDIPATILTSDPGVTGARATAETLDRPLELAIRMRRDLWTDVIRTVVMYAIDRAILAGRLRGIRRIDQITGRERLELRGEQDPRLQVDFPDLSEVDLKTQMEAIKAADDLGKLPPLLIAQMAMTALQVDDLDAWLKEITDDEGNFTPPDTAVADAAGSAAARAMRNGDDPAEML